MSFISSFRAIPSIGLSPCILVFTQSLQWNQINPIFYMIQYKESSLPNSNDASARYDGLIQISHQLRPQDYGLSYASPWKNTWTHGPRRFSSSQVHRLTAGARLDTPVQIGIIVEFLSFYGDAHRCCCCRHTSAIFGDWHPCRTVGDF